MNQDTNYLNSLLKDLTLDESKNKTSPIVRDTNLYNRKINTNLPPSSYYQNNKVYNSNSNKAYTSNKHVNSMSLGRADFSKNIYNNNLQTNSIYNYNMTSYNPKTRVTPQNIESSHNKFQEENNNDKMLQFTMTPKNTPFPIVKQTEFPNSYQSTKKDNTNLNQHFQKYSPLPKNISNNPYINSNKINYDRITPSNTRTHYNFNNDN